MNEKKELTPYVNQIQKILIRDLQQNSYKWSSTEPEFCAGMKLEM